MNWDAIGATAEAIGAIAVVITLVFLVIQLRRGTNSIDESNRLQKAAAIDRHNDSVSRWRGRLIESKETAQLWSKVKQDEVLDKIEQIQVHNLFVDLVNTQRANYTRAKIVGEEGLCKLAVNSIFTELRDSENLSRHWDNMKPWLELVSADFLNAIDQELDRYKVEGTSRFLAGPEYPESKSEV